MIFFLVALGAMPWLQSGYIVPMTIAVIVVGFGLLQVVWQWPGRLGLYGFAGAFFWFVFLDDVFPAPEWTSFGFGDWPIQGVRFGLPIATIVGAFLLLFIPRRRKS